MANAFNEHFINIGSNLAQLIPQTNYPPVYYINSVDKTFTFRQITEEEVRTSKFALKFMLSILVFEIKEGKNAQKIKNYSQ
jgi:hypothetical protein